MTLQRSRLLSIKEVALLHDSVRRRRRRQEHMRRWQLRARKRRNAGIDMHCFLQYLSAVLRSQAAVMAGNVVSCSLPVVACSFHAVGCGVCRHIMGCEVPLFCDMSSNVVARLDGEHLVLRLFTFRRRRLSGTHGLIKSSYV